MKKYITILSVLYFSIVAVFANYTFNKGKHTIKFTQDTSVYITPATDNIDFTGFGYYVNNTFYELSENDIKNALEFKAGEEVMFVRHHNKNAFHKMTLWKTDSKDPLNNIYKIGGKGNGNIQIKILPESYKVSGQPLPGVYVTIAIAIFLLILYFCIRPIVEKYSDESE
jgi:hypothetical protein